MNHEELANAVRDLAIRTNAQVGEASWFLFGSMLRASPDMSDIDIAVVCSTPGVADAVRRTVDVDQFARPIHLSIFTKAEDTEIRFTEKQGCIQII